MRRILPRLLVLWLLLPVTCDDTPELGPRAQGPSVFSTPAPPAQGSPGLGEGPSGGGHMESPADIPPGPSTVLEGERLFTFNPYRGLQIVELAGPAPRVLGQVPMMGRPVALFRSGGALLAVMAGTTSNTACAGCPPDGRATGSHLQALDTSDPAAPRLQAGLPVEGSVVGAQLRENSVVLVSRLGSELSLDRGAGTLVLSVDVTDPAAPRELSRVELPGPAWADQVTFAGDTLFVGLYGWHRWSGATCDALGPSEAPVPGQGCTKLVAIDLATGLAGAPVDVSGRVAAGGLHMHQGILQALIVADPSKTVSGGASPAVLHAFDVAPGATLGARGALEIPAGPWGPPLFRFEGHRALVATSDAARPLLILDGAGPQGPALSGQLPTPGLVRQILDAGPDRVLTVGQTKDGNACPVHQLAHHDLTDPAAPRLMGQATLDGIDDRVVYDRATGLLVRPFRAPVSSGIGEIASPIGIELFDVDPVSGVFRARGRTVLEGRLIEEMRSLGDRLLVMSHERLELVDTTNRDAPRLAGEVELSRWAADVVFAADRAVVVVNDPYRGKSHLYLLPAEDPNAVEPLAALTLEGDVARIFAHERYVYLFWHASLRTGRSDPRLDVLEVGPASLTVRASQSLAGFAPIDFGPDNAGEGAVGWGARQVSGSTFVLPVRRVTECAPAQPGAMGGSSPGSRGTCAGPPPPPPPPPLAPAPPIAELPAVTAQWQSAPCPGAEADFLVLDASAADAPRVVGLGRFPGEGELTSSLVHGTRIFFTQVEGTHEAAQSGTPAPLRFFATEVELANPGSPAVGPRVNLPGPLLAIRDADQTWFSARPLFDPTGRGIGLVVSALYRPSASARAFLERELEIPGQVSGPIVDGTRLFATVDGALVAVDLAGAAAPGLVSRVPVPGATTSSSPSGGGPLPEGAPAATPAVAADVHQVVQGRVFVMLGGRAMVVFDARDATQPRLLEPVVFSPRGAHPVRLAPGNRAMVPRAEWGVAVVDL